MLWRTSIAAQRHTPRAEVAMACSGRPGFLAESQHNLGRWRS
jgi:hypothetical protein